MRLRRTALATLTAAAIAVPTLATAALASAPAPAAATASAVTSFKKSAEPTKSASSGKNARQVKFAADGRATAVDATAGTVTLVVRHGTKEVRGRTITVAVPSGARIRVNGRKLTLAEVSAGFRIDVAGRKVDGVWTAAVLIAKGKVRATPAPSVTASPSPSVSTPGDDDSDHDSGDDNPSTSPSVSPSVGSSDD